MPILDVTCQIEARWIQHHPCVSNQMTHPIFGVVCCSYCMSCTRRATLGCWMELNYPCFTCWYGCGSSSQEIAFGSCWVFDKGVDWGSAYHDIYLMPSTVAKIESYRWLNCVLWLVQPEDIDMHKALSPEFLAYCNIFKNSSCLCEFAITYLGPEAGWPSHAIASLCPSGILSSTWILNSCLLYDMPIGQDITFSKVNNLSDLI